jgi:hypothetical protein
MYVVDRENHCIRTISQDGVVKLVCGASSLLASRASCLLISAPPACDLPASRLVLEDNFFQLGACTCNDKICIRQLSPAFRLVLEANRRASRARRHASSLLTLSCLLSLACSTYSCIPLSNNTVTRTILKLLHSPHFSPPPTLSPPLPPSPPFPPPSLLFPALPHAQGPMNGESLVLE